MSTIFDGISVYFKASGTKLDIYRKIWGQTPMKSIACVSPSVLRRRRVVLSRQRVSNDVVCDSGQSDRLCCGTGKGNLWAAHDCGWRHPS